ncbi:MAG: cysteine hydrolase [Ruminococcaceae bacterium]|nr:cysteine hydrolase [Oscillospiraceae bacterium]
MKFLIVVDMQEDFVRGALGSAAAEAIVPRVVEKVKAFDGTVLFTRDTHGEDYRQTQEGRKLPVVHCVKDTAGWQIVSELLPYVTRVVDKPTFGSVDLPRILADYGDVDEVTLCGLCTDICVISNAMLVKAAFPEATVTVDGTCSAGVSEESHRTALQAMRAVQIEVVE